MINSYILHARTHTCADISTRTPNNEWHICLPTWFLSQKARRLAKATCRSYSKRSPSRLSPPPFVHDGIGFKEIKSQEGGHPIDCSNIQKRKLSGPHARPRKASDDPTPPDRVIDKFLLDKVGICRAIEKGGASVNQY